MSREPIVIELTNAAQFDGSTLITLTRDALTVTGQRYYAGSLTTGGVIAGDFFGLFQQQSVKLVGVSGLSHNGQSTVKVVTPYTSGRVRKQVDLRPDIQYVLVYPDDKLVITTAEPTSTRAISLVVNELTEANHLAYAMSIPEVAERRRFRIFRGAGESFVASATPWNPAFVFAPTKGVLYSTSVVNGSLPASALSLRGVEENIYVRVRFAGIKEATGEIVMVEQSTGDVQVLQTALNSCEWSDTFELGYYDHIGFNADNPDVGGAIGLDLDVVHVLPGDHLAKRHDGEIGGGAAGIVKARDALDVNKVYIPMRVDTLIGTGVSRVISKYAGTLTRIDSITEGALSVGDATLTSKIAGLAVTTGVITIAQAGSAAGDKDSCVPTAANTVAVGDELSLTCGGSNGTATVANCVFEITRT